MITYISSLSYSRLKGKEVIRWQVVRKYTSSVKQAADRSLITVCMHRRKELGTFRRCIKYKSCQEFLRMTGMRRNHGRMSMPCRRQKQIRGNTFSNICRKHKFFKLINCILLAFGDTGDRNSDVHCFAYLYSAHFCLPTVIYNWSERAYYYDAFLDQCLMYLGMSEGEKKWQGQSRARKPVSSVFT